MKKNHIGYQLKTLDTKKDLRKDSIYAAFGGGIGKFGANFSLFKYGTDTVWIDIGAGFESQQYPGIDKRLPNLNLLASFPPSVIVFTHAHEDHIGSFSWVTSWIPANTPIVTSRFTFEILSRKIQEYGLKAKDFNFVIINENTHYELKELKLSFFFMPHSIPHLFSVGIHFLKEDKKMYFTSDFKTKGSEKRFSPTNIQNYGPIDFLFCDSTGSLGIGYTPSEEETTQNLKQIIQEWQGRVFITLFASNIERMRSIFEIANATQRKVGLIGRSVGNYFKSAYYAKEVDFLMQHITPPSNKDSKAIWVISGCQADRGSAFYRLANNLITGMELKKGDLFIYSASIIPGNDEAIYDAINKIATKKAWIYGLSGGEKPVHASGHGKQQDTIDLVDWLRPKHIIPIHGDALHFNSFNKIFKNHSIISIECNKVYNLSHHFEIEADIYDQDFFVDGNLLHSENKLFKIRNNIHKNGVCIVGITSQSTIQLSYVGVMDENNLLDLKPFLEEEVQRLVTAHINFNHTSISEEQLTKIESKLSEKIFDSHIKIIGKEPYIHILWL